MSKFFDWFMGKEKKKEVDDCVFRISYTMNTDKKMVIDVFAPSEATFNSHDLAVFTAFISSPPGVHDTIDTIKTGLEDVGEGDTYKEFIETFLTFKKEEVELSNKEDGGDEDEGPLISSLEVL